MGYLDKPCEFCGSDDAVEIFLTWICNDCFGKKKKENEDKKK